MDLLIFGTGMIVNDFLDGIEEMPFDNVFLCGRSKNKIDALVEKFNLSGAYYEVDEVLASNAEVVYVGLPNNLHFDYAKRSLEAGKHVIVEKPFMATYDQAKEIFKLAEEKKLMAFEASLVFYFPAYKSMVEDLPNLGEIHLADCNFSQYSSRYDRFLKNDIAPALNIKNCGGALMDLNVYNINLMVGLFGEPNSAKYFPTIKKDIDVSGLAVLDYGNSKASLKASKSTSAPRHITLQGEKGNLYLPSSMSRAYEYTIEYHNGEVLNRDFKDSHHRMYHEFCEFERCISSSDFTSWKVYADRCLTTSKILDDCRSYANIVWPK